MVVADGLEGRRSSVRTHSARLPTVKFLLSAFVEGYGARVAFSASYGSL